MHYSLLPVCAGALLLSACASPQQKIALSMVNPASAHCQRMGGESRIHDGPRGQFGTCLMQDGSEVEEWAFFRQYRPRVD